MRPLRPACGTVSNAQLLSFPGTISASANGVVTTQLSFLPPASSTATEVLGSSESRPATAQPPEPPPTTTKSYVSVTRISPDFSCSSFRDGPKHRTRNLDSRCAIAPEVRCFASPRNDSSTGSPASWFQSWAFATFLARAASAGRSGATNARFDRHKKLKRSPSGLSKAGSRWYIPLAPNGVSQGQPSQEASGSD